MAGCSSSVGIANFKSLEKGVVPLECFSSKSLVPTRFWRLGIKESRTSTRLVCNSKRQSLVVVNVINPETESKSSPAVTTTTETGDVNYVGKDAATAVEKSYHSTPDSKNGDGGGLVNGSGGNGKYPGGGGGGGGGGGDEGGDDYEEKEFGPLLKFEEVMRETEARGASLPADMLEAAKTVGLRKLLLSRYLDLQVEICSQLDTNLTFFLCLVNDYGAEFEIAGFGLATWISDEVVLHA